MFRTSLITVAALGLMSSAAWAQSSYDRPNGPPAQLSGSQPYDERDASPYDDRDAPPPPSSGDPYSNDRAQAPANGPADNQPQTQAQSQDQRSRDLFCRRDAAARVGYVTPGEAARHEQSSGSIGGAVTGAALGAIIGGASHAAGPGALIGAGAGLIAGTAIGSDNARHAAADVERAYGDAYYACMDEAADDRRPGPDYAYGPPPPPPVYYGPAPYPYYYPPYYGPRVTFGIGFGGFRGGFGGGFRGGFRGHR